MVTVLWLMLNLVAANDARESTDRLVPPGWQGNPWGPEANRARRTGKLPPIPVTPEMARWDRWGKQVLKDGDIVFRRGDARILLGYFAFSKFLADVSGSPFSHTGIVAIEDGLPVVYDTTRSGVRRQPLSIWVLDNTGPFGVKRVKAELAGYAHKAVAFCRELYKQQPPFDYDLNIDDKAYYCVEMTEKAYRKNGLPLADPVLLGDMENVTQYPLSVIALLQISNLRLDQPVYFPGNERHGIWSSKHLVTVYAPLKKEPLHSRDGG